MRLRWTLALVLLGSACGTPDFSKAIDASVDAGSVRDDASADASDGGVVVSDATPDGACGDTQNDPSHCGACGHSCLGSTCSGGMCTPETLATGLAGTIGIALNATDAYVADEDTGKLFRVPLDGGADGGPAAQFHSTGAAPHALALSGTRLYWIDQNNIGYRPLTGGGAATLSLGALGRSLVLESGRLYYATEAANVQSVDLDLTNPLTHASGGSPRGVAAAGAWVYWADESGSIGRAALPDGGSGAMILSQTGALCVVLDSTNVYWSTATDVRTAVRGTWTPSNLATGGGQIYGLALDRGDLFWVDAVSSTVRAVSAKGGPVRTIAVNQPQRQDYPRTQMVAATATHVYWLSSGDGALRRVAR